MQINLNIYQYSRLEIQGKTAKISWGNLFGQFGLGNSLFVSLKQTKCMITKLFDINAAIPTDFKVYKTYDHITKFQISIHTK